MLNIDLFNNLQEPGVYAFYYSDDSDGFGITFFDWHPALDDIIGAMDWWHDMSIEFGVDEESLYDIVWDDEFENEEDWSEGLAGDPDA